MPNLHSPLSGIIPACVTPFIDDHADAGAMQANISRWLEIGVHGLLVFGSTGEFAYLEDDERRRLLAAARQVTPADRLLLVGCGAESTIRAVRYLHEAAEDGADAALVVTPVYFTRGNTDAQRRHFLTLADASPIPVLIYNVAAFTAYDLPVETILELAQHPNIRGIKDSTGEFRRVALQVGAHLPDFAVFSGSPTLVFPALAMGAAGSITAFANIIPEIFLGLWQAVQAQDMARAAHLQGVIIDLHDAIGKFGVAGVKAVLRHRRFQPGDPRAPLQPLGPEAAAKAVSAWERAMAGLSK